MELGRFFSYREASEFLGITVNQTYYWAQKPDKLRKANGKKFYIEVEGRAPNLRSDISETKLRAKETEDETRKRLGLSPYGKHNDEEWMLALIKKVEKRLIDEGYDPKVEFQRRREWNKIRSNKVQDDSEDEVL